MKIEIEIGIEPSMDGKGFAAQALLQAYGLRDMRDMRYFAVGATVRQAVVAAVVAAAECLPAETRQEVAAAVAVAWAEEEEAAQAAVGEGVRVA